MAMLNDTYVNGNLVVSGNSNISGNFALSSGPSVTSISKLSSVTTLGYTSDTESDARIPTVSMLAYWNGAYAGTSSNLKYCDRGRFGTMCTATSTDYLARSGDSMNGLLTLKAGNTHLGAKIGNTYMTAIDGEVIFQNNTAIRFGTDAWDYDQWAGLKYTHSAKTISLGLADKSVFVANNAQSAGILELPGIDRIDLTNQYHGIKRLDGSAASTTIPVSSSTATITAPSGGNTQGMLLYSSESASSDYGVLYLGSDGIAITNSGDCGWHFKVYDKDASGYNFGSDTGFVFGVGQTSGNIRLGVRETTSTPGSMTKKDRITIIPTYHTGGPWNLKTADDSNSAYLDLNYSSTSIVSVRHQGDISTNGSVYAGSDRRLKCNFKKPDLEPLKVINQLKLTEFNFKTDENKDDKYYGLIAQNLLKVLPDKYKHKLVSTNTDGMYTINEGKFPYLLLGGIQELSKQNDKLKKENIKLKKEIKSLKKDIKAIKKALNLK